MIKEDTIKEFIRERLKYCGYNKKLLKIMLGDKEYSLIKNIIHGLEKLNADDLKRSIKEYVKLYTRNKDSAIEAYKKYLDF